VLLLATLLQILEQIGKLARIDIISGHGIGDE
jgi:hypothetical protein